MRQVLSNNRSRAALFYCHVLGTSPDFSSMAGNVNGIPYINDYFYLVSEIVDGRTPSVVWRRYASDVSPHTPMGCPRAFIPPDGLTASRPPG